MADEVFAPVFDAAVRVRVTDPNGDAREVSATLVEAETGRYVAEVEPTLRGVYQVRAFADRGSGELGRADAAVLVGGADLELTDPRRQSAVLRRVAEASGGRLLDVVRIDELVDALRANATQAPPTGTRSMGHTVGLSRGGRRVVGGMGSETSVGASMTTGEASAAWPARWRGPLCGAVLTMLVTGLSARPAVAQDQFTLLVTGASGGARFKENHDRWRAALVTALRNLSAFDDAHLIALAETPGPGIGRASREGVR